MAPVFCTNLPKFSRAHCSGAPSGHARGMLSGQLGCRLPARLTAWTGAPATVAACLLVCAFVLALTQAGRLVGQPVRYTLVAPTGGRRSQAYDFAAGPSAANGSDRLPRAHSAQAAAADSDTSSNQRGPPALLTRVFACVSFKFNVQNLVHLHTVRL